MHCAAPYLFALATSFVLGVLDGLSLALPGLFGKQHGLEGDLALGAGCKLTFETNGFKALYFQGVETQALSTRGVKLLCSTCTALTSA